MNDIIIIGGGISGLYLQYKLLKRRKYKKVLLVEKYNRLGGRIFTYKTNVNNTNYSMEAGAGRFSNNHKNLFALIRDMRLSNKIIEIGGKVDYYPRKLKWKKSKASNFSPYDYIDLILKEIKIDKSLQQLTFGEFLNKNINKEINEFIRDTYPYKDVFKTNAYDAIRLYKKDLKDSTRFFILKGGLNQVIDNLKKAKSSLKENDQIGVEMIIKSALSVLKNYGVEEIETKENDDYDSNFHESIGQEKCDLESGKIVKVIESGFKRNNKCIITSKVITAE